MKKMALLLVAVVLLGLTMIGCRDTIGPNDSKELTIELEGNPTTGYEWQYSADPSGIIEEISADYSAASPDTVLAGEGGVFVFVFKGIAPGKTQLTFEYLRSWEEGVQPIQTAVYDVVVDENFNIVAELIETTGDQDESATSK